MSALANASGLPEALLVAARPVFAKAIWDWFDANRDRVLFAKKILFFSFSIRVSDFEGIIGEIAGPRPVVAA